MKNEITFEKFNELLKLYPDYEKHTIGFCTPNVTFYWKDKGEPGCDRSHGKDSFLFVKEQCPYSNEGPFFYEVEDEKK